ncbi:hypothetical protein ACLKA6_001657 [Drosophila palustris]
MPDEPHSTVGDERVRVGRPPADEAWWLEHPIPSPARSVTEEGEPVPWIEKTRSPKASPKHTQRRRVDRPDPSATTRSAMGAGLRSGSEGGTPRLWQLSGHGELEVDPTSVFPHISIRFKPGVVTNTRSTRPENVEPGDPPSLLRKRLRSRGRAQRSRSRRKRAKVAPLETAVPLAAAGQIVADEADHPAAKPGPVREAQAAEERPPWMSPSSAPDEPQEAAASPTESELLREMDDLLEGWEPELDEMMGEVAATLEPLIPRGWRAEVNRLGGEYHRSRFRVVDGEVLYTVTINAAGAVTLDTNIDKRSYSRQGKSCPPWVIPARISLLLVVPTNRVVVLCSTCGRWDTGTHPLYRSPAALLHFAREHPRHESKTTTPLADEPEPDYQRALSALSNITPEVIP